jgi:hypothetical protein
MKPLAWFLISISTIVMAQQQQQQKSTFTIAGHNLGESFSEALSKEGSTGKVNDCRTRAAEKHTPKRDRDVVVKFCQRLIDASEGRRGEVGRGWLNGKPDPLGVVFRFSAGQLVAIESTLNMSGDSGLSYDVVELDAVAKYGAPSQQGTTTWQNGFGATWHPRWSQWENNDLVIRIEENPQTSNLRNPIITIRGAYVKELADEAAESGSQHKNIFDDK